MINNIIPTPKKLDLGEGRAQSSLFVYTDHELWKEYANTFCISFNKIYKSDMKIGEGGIRLVYDPDIEKDAYTLDADDEITLCA